MDTLLIMILISLALYGAYRYWHARQKQSTEFVKRDESGAEEAAPSQARAVIEPPELKMMPPSSPAAPTPEEAEAAPEPTRSGGASRSIDDIAAGAQQVQFSAYYPREVRSGKWYPLAAYVYRVLAAAKVKADAQKQYGAIMDTLRDVVQASKQQLKEGALITATPDLPGFQFNPPRAQVGFFEDWHRLDFKLRAKDAPADLASNGRLTFTVEGVIVADVPLSIFVGDGTTRVQADRVTTAVKPYPAVFASYSHDDARIVEQVERAYKALGMDYLRDVHALKSGQDWDDRLLELIEQADIFQLFWSQAAAQSPYVRQEWQHALSLERDDYFIRPVYWVEPIAPVPDALSHIHFAYQPELDD